MHAIRRLAGIGVGVAMLAGGAATAAGASTPVNAGAAKAASVQPDYTACSMTVTHPTAIYKNASFTGGHYGGGKHTGQGVTSSWGCAYFQNGFHQVNLSGGGDGWIYTSDLGRARPGMTVESRYRITGSVNVRNAPSTTYGKVIGTKTKGQIVTSPIDKNDFNNGGFAEVLMGNGSVGWISSAFVQ
jgi:hypothetical protein